MLLDQPLYSNCVDFRSEFTLDQQGLGGVKVNRLLRPGQQWLFVRFVNHPCRPIGHFNRTSRFVHKSGNPKPIIPDEQYRSISRAFLTVPVNQSADLIASLNERRTNQRNQQVNWFHYSVGILQDVLRRPTPIRIPLPGGPLNRLLFTDQDLPPVVSGVEGSSRHRRQTGARAERIAYGNAKNGTEDPVGFPIQLCLVMWVQLVVPLLGREIGKTGVNKVK